MKSDSVLWQKPQHRQNNPKSTVTTQNRHQNFDYTSIADRLKTVSWGNDSHQTGVVKLVYGIQPSHSPQKLCDQKDTY